MVGAIGRLLAVGGIVIAGGRAVKGIRCVIDTENDPAEISLDENVTREDLHPADQFERFRELAEDRGWEVRSSHVADLGRPLASSCDLPLRNPITGTTGWCARASGGHAAAAPPSSMMNSRRFSWPSCIHCP
jgi:hypothetical protein